MAEPTPVRLTHTQVTETPDLLLWKVIEESTKALSFENYDKFMNYVLCGADYPTVAAEPSTLEAAATDQDSLAKPKRANPNVMATNQLPTIPDDVERRDYPVGGKTNPKGISPTADKLRKKRYLPYTDADAYRLLKVATEAFVAVNCAVELRADNFTHPDPDILKRVDADELSHEEWEEWWSDYQLETTGVTPAEKLLPLLALIRQKLPDVRVVEQINDEKFKETFIECTDILRAKLVNPCLLELIWSYWHEEGMLVQTMNAISRRFQNIRGPADKDPLAMLELGYLRPLNNLLWGYIQDEQHRLSVVRRAYEYDHHYGLALQGKAVPELRPADSRSKFLEAFHNLLHLCTNFFKQDDDTTVKADGFPVLNGIKDVHMLLIEGQHNQFGDLPSTARVEMLIQQWLLARPEFREILPTRESVVYPEPWMERVDAMKKLQGWTDMSVRHFYNLAVFGEQILLSIRFGAWSKVNDPEHAVIWARFWRAAIQSYIYAYHAVTGVNLTFDVSQPQERALWATQPAVLLSQRLSRNGARPMLSAGTQRPATMPSFRERRAARK